jgi:hypothetical protein
MSHPGVLSRYSWFVLHTSELFESVVVIVGVHVDGVKLRL